MRIICIFNGNKLLDQSTSYHPSTVDQFKQNVAFQSGLDASALESIMFEDSDIVEYVETSKWQNKKKIEISKTSLKLIELEDTIVPKQVRLKWTDCDEATIEANFTLEDQIKIAENKSYFDSLGNDKYKTGFVFEWPHVIIGPLVDAEGTEAVPVVKKEILAQIL